MDGPLALLVEDDVDLRLVAEAVLEQEGVRVVTADNGARALSLLDEIDPDVIVTDMMMPELDGLDFLKRYRRRPAPRAPVMAVSGFLPYLQRARALGAVDTMAKPYDPRALAKAVRALAEGKPNGAAPSPPIFPEDEAARRQAVIDLRVEDADSWRQLRRFLDDVAAIFAVPVTGISAVTRERHNLVAQCSSAPVVSGGPREHSFCTHAVAARAALVVQDAGENPLFAQNPCVTERGFQFYAGVPLMGVHGEAIGTLCVLDYVPRHFTHLDLELLGLLARRVLAELEWRDKHRQPDVPDSVYAHLHDVDAELGVYGQALFRDLVAVEASRGIERDEPVALVVLAVQPDELFGTVAALRDNVPFGLIGRLGRTRLGVIVPRKDPEAAQLDVARCAGDESLVRAAALDQYQGAPGTALLHAQQALGDAGL